MAAAAMLLIIISVLITSFQLVIYGDSEYKFYQKEYEKYTVCDALGMKMNDVMRVTEHMMAYLIGEEEELSVITTVEGEKKDFFNEQDRLHMADVRNLFLGGLKVRTACLMLALVLLGTPDSDECGLESADTQGIFGCPCHISSHCCLLGNCVCHRFYKVLYYFP